MSIYIKGMKMPKSSRFCPFTEMDDWDMRCTVGGCYEWHKDRLCDGCPLIEIPPHSDLVERDALMELYADEDDLRLKDMKVPIAVIRQNIMDMPTIIPASGEGK